MDKENNNKLKKYKQKYTTGGRVDYSKGGRVKAQRGGLKKAPRNIEDRPVQVGELAKSNATRRGATPSPAPQPTVTPKKAKPLPKPLPKAPVEPKRPDVVQPTLKKAVAQPAVKIKKPVQDLGPLPPGVPVDVPPIGGPAVRPERPVVEGGRRMITGREELEKNNPQTIVTDALAKPLPKAPVEPKRPDVIQPDVQITLPKFPEEGRPRDDILFAQQQATQQSLEDLKKRFSEGKFTGYAPEDLAFLGDKITDAINQGAVNQNTTEGWWTTAGYDNMSDALQSGDFTFKDGQWVKKDGTEDDAQKAVDKELITARGRAEQILQGDMTGIPMAEAPKEVEIGELGVAKTMAEREALEAKTAEIDAASEAATIKDIETVKTPEQLQAETYRAEQVGVTPDVELTEGEIQENALAKAAKVDRVVPIEGVEVEIPEGALAERVVGVISEGAKATAAINAGTSLSRITRAKKQLSRAGLSDEDIQEIGNDPEALEDRLVDFSEEQRGIIEGLPEEALVSTQINGLLEGMENGEIPTWARPAVAQVEQMLAKRGMSASTVGRDSLFNAIIQSAMPIAQSNAQAIQQSVSQQKTIEAQTAEANAQRVQQTALTNAQNVFNMDMAQFNADQQTSLSNSKFMQTVGITNANNAQQAAIQNAVLMSQANLAEADFYQKAQINNANAFLNMDLTNLNNAQQVNVLKAQQEQQRLLSNQAANNAAAQFNASSENQTQQFMTSLATQVEQFNVAQTNTTAQFNVQQQNARDALNFQVEADLEKANASMVNEINKFNEQTAFERDRFNTSNAQAIEQSNLAWRRQANTANTAAANQVAMQNVQNAFNMTSQAQSFLWQELRDQANYIFQSAENEENRKAQLYAQALANEGGSAENWKNNVSSIGTLINTIFGGK